MKKINCFIPFAGKEQAEKTVQGLQATGLIGNIRLVTTDPTLEPLPGCEILSVDMPYSSTAMKTIAEKTDAEYTLLYTKETTLELGMFALERMMHIAEDSDAGMVYYSEVENEMVYADHYQIADGKQTNAPVIDYQFGSLRDDFNFGSVLLFNTSKLKEAACRMKCDYNFAGLYDLRLKLSQKADLVHINEYLYSEVENDTRKSGEKIFDYVDPKNRNRQIEMEAACTEHLKEIGGYLKPEFKQIEFSAGISNTRHPLSSPYATVYAPSAMLSVPYWTRRQTSSSILSSSTTTPPTERQKPSTSLRMTSASSISSPNATTSASAVAGTWAYTTPNAASLPYNWTATTYMPMKIHWPLWYVLSTNRTAPW